MYSQQMLVFTVLLCLAVVDSRHSPEHFSDAEKPTNGDSEANLNIPLQRDDSVKPMRHREKRWYRHGRVPPPYYNEYDGIQDYVINMRVLSKLDEILDYVRRPPYPPPTPQPVVVQCPAYQCFKPRRTVKCTNSTVPGSFPSRGLPEESERNWGMVVEEEDYEEGEDYNRPVSFDPIPPDTPVQTGNDRPKASLGQGGQSPQIESSLSKQCLAITLHCCDPDFSPVKQRNCFVKMGCENAYKEALCSRDMAMQIIDLFKKSYSFN